MLITHYRLDNTKKSCRGAIYIDNVFYAFVMEDPVRSKKIKSVTAIPAGTYEIKFREELTELTKKYRDIEDYKGWFTWHLHLQNVPGYSGVYDHHGNFPSNTDGCRLINNQMHANNDDQLFESRPSFEKYYKRVSAALKRGEKVHTKIINLFESIGQEVL